MFNGTRITELLQERHATKRDLYRAIEISATGLDKIIEGTNVRAENLEKIADFFQMPIDYFFDRKSDVVINDLTVGHTLNGNGNITGDIMLSAEDAHKEIIHLQETLQNLKELLTEKERTIKILMEK